VLRIAHVSKRFGGVTAVDRVSFHVAANIITGIIGPNGAGKTTLFNIISGLYAQDEGTVHLLDHDLSSLPPEKRVRLGIVRTFQISSFSGG